MDQRLWYPVVRVSPQRSPSEPCTVCEEEGALDPYWKILLWVYLYDLTNFALAINHVTLSFFVLLTITNGFISAVLLSLEALQQSFTLVMSTIIVGVEDADLSRGCAGRGEEKGQLVVPRIVTTADWGPMDESVDAAGDLRFPSGPGVSATLPSERRRSLSGGAHRLPALQLSSRARRQSGDDVLGGVSPSRKAVLFDAFRPRSKSDSKGSSSSGSRKPNNLMSALRGHSWFPGSRSALTPPNGAAGGGGGASAPMSPLSPLSPVDPEAPFRRPRSGSESRTGAVSKVMDLFRSRSQSVSVEGKSKKFPGSTTSSQYGERSLSVRFMFLRGNGACSGRIP
ncbi:hypothetical protein HPB50_027595 [Hyalomma asiaticum]|uniref:Uncharacterized protein n=1 Tax=Hyalomma asiaticum TaxID=266040 RepID=A0ACB7T0K1_HYAAI|nr:hypothetical protein HPB50_027595 [Hyalomma asiaticum]